MMWFQWKSCYLEVLAECIKYLGTWHQIWQGRVPNPVYPSEWGFALGRLMFMDNSLQNWASTLENYPHDRIVNISQVLQPDLKLSILRRLTGSRSRICITVASGRPHDATHAGIWAPVGSMIILPNHGYTIFGMYYSGIGGTYNQTIFVCTVDPKLGVVCPGILSCKFHPIYDSMHTGRSMFGMFDR